MKSALPPRDEVVDYLLSFDLYKQIGNEEEGIGYVKRHVDRFIRTIELMPNLGANAKVLELGASPYFMSFMMRKYLGYEVTPANFFGDYAEKLDQDDEMTVSSERYGESQTFRYKTFNLERDYFPYPDGSFDIVLCCEILEHLANDPSHLMREAHRVLRPDGFFVLTTPNAIRMENVFAILTQENIYPAYSGYGVYGRHNREYSPWELGELFTMHHFDPDVIVEDVYPHSAFQQFLTRWGFRKRRDNLFVIGRKHGASVEVHPEWLYEHPQGMLRVTDSRILMGRGEFTQLGEGWHGYEHPPGMRWTSRQAVAYLLPQDGLTRLAVRGNVGPQRTRGRIEVNGALAGEFDLEAGRKGELVFDLPQAAVDSIHKGEAHTYEVKIALDDVFVPSRDFEDSDDERELGLGVEAIALTASAYTGGPFDGEDETAG